MIWHLSYMWTIVCLYSNPKSPDSLYEGKCRTSVSFFSLNIDEEYGQSFNVHAAVIFHYDAFRWQHSTFPAKKVNIVNASALMLELKVILFSCNVKTDAVRDADLKNMVQNLPNLRFFPLHSIDNKVWITRVIHKNLFINLGPGAHSTIICWRVIFICNIVHISTACPLSILWFDWLWL